MRTRYVLPPGVVPPGVVPPGVVPPGALARGLLRGGLTVALIVLAGCGPNSDYLDPYKKPYTWHPTGAPAANIAAQLVDPHDLVAGRGTTTIDTQESTLEIQHIWLDTPKSFSSGGSGGTGSAGSPGASGAGPGASGGSPGGSGGSPGGSN
jgi:hypothetical protein